MDTKTAQSYENAIQKYKNLIAELEKDEDFEMIGGYEEILTDLIDEYEYLKSDESAFQRYLEQQRMVQEGIIKF